MRDRPDVSYAHNGDVAIAYQLFGSGEQTLVCIPGFVSNLVWNWELDSFRRMLERLGSLSRVLILDRRGVGLSDRLSGGDLPSLEVAADDVLAVMDHAGVDQAALFGWQSGASLALLLAASSPDRVTRLATFSADPCPLRKPDWPFGWEADDWDDYLDELRSGWGTREWVRGNVSAFSPDSDPAMFEDWGVTMFQLSANPATATAIERLDMLTDVRAALPAIQVPTWLIHREHGVGEEPERLARVHGLIAGSRLVLVAGRDNPPYTSHTDEIVDVLEEFLTGTPAVVPLDRVLATVLFTDIVGSTQHQAAVGDRAWRAVVERHHAVVRSCLTRWRGVENDTAGDGFYATFDGPARAVRCALEIADRVRGIGLEIRAGVHTGEVERVDGKYGGIAVVTGARIAALAPSGEVWASSTVKGLTAGSGLAFHPRGEHELKGVPETWSLFSVTDPDARATA